MKPKNIDYVIDQAETVPLSSEDLKALTNGKCNIMLYSDLMEYENIDDVLEPHGAVILLYQTTERTYGHYVTLFKKHNNPKVLEFYDSYGLSIDKQLKFSKFNSKNMGGVAVAHLTDLIQKSNYRVESNTKGLQKNKSQDNTCGRYAALRVIFRQLTNQQFNYTLSSNRHYDSDYAVSVLTLYHQDFIDILKS